MGVSVSNLRIKIGKMFIQLHIDISNIKGRGIIRERLELLSQHVSATQKLCLTTQIPNDLYDIVNIEFPKIINIINQYGYTYRVNKCKRRILKMTPLIITLAQRIEFNNYS